jgi:hypothetical protein
MMQDNQFPKAVDNVLFAESSRVSHDASTSPIYPLTMRDMEQLIYEPLHPIINRKH